MKPQSLLDRMAELERLVLLVVEKKCPEGCARYAATGTCVHLVKDTKEKVKYTEEFALQRAANKAARIGEQKRKTPVDVSWFDLERDQWDVLPYTFGVVVWVDVNARLLLAAKTTDARRRHYNWARSGKSLWDEVKTIWFLHTGWYEEILAELGKLEKDVVITKEVLEKVVTRAKPLELPEPPVGVGR